MKLQNIKAVIFDFDDTLADREVYAYRCAREILKENTDVKDPIELEAMVQDWMLLDEKGNITKQHIRERIEKKYGITLPYEDINAYWASQLWKYCVPFEDSEETLNYLAGKYKLGIITNGTSIGQRKKLKQSGLDKYFDPEHVIVSKDYPFSKPDPRIFRVMCEKLDVKPEECVFVGDIFSNDILGAYRVGMTPIWIWTQGKRLMEADILTIHRISELINYL